MLEAFGQLGRLVSMWVLVIHHYAALLTACNNIPYSYGEVGLGVILLALAILLEADVVCYGDVKNGTANICGNVAN